MSSSFSHFTVVLLCCHLNNMNFRRVFLTRHIFLKMETLLAPADRVLLLNTCREYSKYSKDPEFWSNARYKAHYAEKSINLINKLPLGIRNCSLSVFSHQQPHTLFNELIHRIYINDIRSFTRIDLLLYPLRHIANSLQGVNSFQTILFYAYEDPFAILNTIFRPLTLFSNFKPSTIIFIITNKENKRLFEKHILISFTSVKTLIVAYQYSIFQDLHTFLKRIAKMFPNLQQLYIYTKTIYTITNPGLVNKDDNHKFGLPYAPHLNTLHISSKHCKCMYTSEIDVGKKTKAGCYM